VELPRFGPDVTADDVAVAVQECGAAVVERFVPADEVSALRAELAPFREATPEGRNDFEGFDTRRVYALFAKVRGFDRLAIDPLVLGVLDRVLGPYYQLSGPVGIDIGPGESAQGLHQDDIVYPLPFPHPPVVLNTMWALDDFTEDNGATRVVLGSHDTSSQDRPDPAGAVTATMPAGSVMFYVGTVWHEGGANRTDQRRLGVILEYVVSWLRAQETHLLAVPRDVARTLPPRLQELLGYNIFPPFLGYVDGRHPRRVLDERSQ
jgi:ectoine hydroxylase-related dioxygenase (phytanoyl-CoA dioxygenase family)